MVLGISCCELASGKRLPGTREPARRFGVHANTASAAYRWNLAAGPSIVLRQDGNSDFVQLSHDALAAFGEYRRVERFVP